MKVFSLTQDQFNTHANDAVDNFLAGLYNEKVITKEQLDDYRKYRLAVVETTFWGNLWDLLTGKKDVLVYYVVKPASTRLPK
jgi:hypothetical protein